MTPDVLMNYSYRPPDMDVRHYEPTRNKAWMSKDGNVPNTASRLSSQKKVPFAVFFFSVFFISTRIVSPTNCGRQE